MKLILLVIITPTPFDNDYDIEVNPFETNSFNDDDGMCLFLLMIKMMKMIVILIKF